MKLMGQMMLFILLPAVVGLMLLSAIGYWMAGGLVQNQIRYDVSAVIDSESVGLEAVFQGLDEALLPFTENRRVRTLAKAWNDASPEVRAAGVRALDESILTQGSGALRGFVDHSQAVYLAMLIGADGKVLAYRLDGQGDELHKAIGEDYSSRPYFKACIESGQAVQKTIVSKSTGDISTMIALPLRLDGKIAAIVAVGIRNSFISTATLERIKVGEGGHSYAFGYDGHIVLHKNKEKIGKTVSETPLFHAMKREPTGRMEIKGEDGRDKFVYWKALPKEQWYLAFELDADEILAPTHIFLRNMMLLGAGFGLVVGCIIFFMANGISGLVGAFSRITAAVAGGRLKESPEEKTMLDKAMMRKDEFKVMGEGMRRMMQSLSSLIKESEEKTVTAENATKKAKEATASAEEAARRAEAAKTEGMHAAANQLEAMASAISAAATELSAQVEQSDRGAVESSQRLGEAATAMNEMNSTVQEVAHNASSASQLSVTMRGNAENGQKILQKAMQSISEVQRVSSELHDDMEKLNQHTQDISKIMNVISDIADQTNLLALNAAIEAARAGEAGRGFAVVADEVRKLAEKTMSSTNDVSIAITAIQGSAEQSVSRMNEALSKVEESTSLAQQSGEALSEIVSNIEETSDQVQAIAAAAEEQSAASEEINRSIVTVNEMSGQTAQAMNEAAEAVSNLAQQAESLASLIEEMKK
ncbi:MAG: methyl-accepting chemotaxis protein [Desulfovibrio sp.]|nr:methyl-accepting chemotaxis protein [Desulfovibrio sp.]